VPLRIFWAQVSCICSVILPSFCLLARSRLKPASPPSYMDSTAVLRTIAIVAHLIKLCLR
jgi:hypothetical protein